MEITIKDKKYNIDEITVKDSQEVFKRAVTLISKVATNKVIQTFIKGIDKSMDTQAFLIQGAQLLPVLLNLAFDDTIGLISCVANIPQDELENFGISKLLLIIEAIAKENDIAGIIENLKNSVGAIKATLKLSAPLATSAL
ncbi:hypothetical protein [Clostridium pasteurianum]|uniref:Uncharacterized protein n=1 Tax=Clostridium pasteurianum BC1 TaxID=86416 RepID=R4K2S4_CLOPA|nr:hypothetical protein [Clostridium pasteurianum]AGK97412.1 hypothetical protein Clopa_2552 [Clostridium pasteurianum BC1]